MLLVDDHTIVRECLAVLMERMPRMTVVGHAAAGDTAVEIARRLKPDIVIMDLILPGLNGIDATRRILEERPRTRVIILSASQTSEHAARALRAGAMAYVSKQSAVAELAQAMSSVLEGKIYLSPPVAAALDSLPNVVPLRSPLERLSVREREVLQLTVEGNTSTAIGRRLSLSPKTVETYRSRIMQKLGVADRTALIHFAIEHALTPL